MTLMMPVGLAVLAVHSELYAKVLPDIILADLHS